MSAPSFTAFTAVAAGGLAHVAVAVESIDAAAPLWERLGARCVGREEVPAQKVRVAFFLLGGVLFELLEPTDPDGPLGRSIAKRGPGLHHVSIEVDDVAAALAAWKAAGVPLVDEAPRKGAEGREVAFLHPRAAGGVLIEVVGRGPRPKGG